MYYILLFINGSLKYGDTLTRVEFAKRANFIVDLILPDYLLFNTYIKIDFFLFSVNCAEITIIVLLYLYINIIRFIYYINYFELILHKH